MKKIKICYLISHLENTGPVNVLYGLIKNLDFKFFEPMIVTLKEEKENSKIEEFRKIGLEIICLKIREFDVFYNKKVSKKLNEIIKKNGIDILHSYCLKSAILSFKIKGVKKIDTIHSTIYIYFIEKFGKIKGKILIKIYQIILKKMDKIISCGKAVNDINCKKLKIKSIAIMNGIEIEQKKCKEINLKKELNINEAEYCLIAVNRLSKGKNLNFIIEEIEKWNFSNKNKIKLLILGTGSEENILKKKFANNKEIYFLGYKSSSEVYEYLKIANGFISGSLSEGMPMSVLEALYFNLDCILSDIEPHKELFDLSPENCIIFKNNDTTDLQKKLKLALKKQKIKSQNLYLRNMISAKRMSKEHMEIYNEVINEHI